MVMSDRILISQIGSSACTRVKLRQVRSSVVNCDKNGTRTLAYLLYVSRFFLFLGVERLKRCGGTFVPFIEGLSVKCSLRTLAVISMLLG